MDQENQKLEVLMKTMLRDFPELVRSAFQDVLSLSVVPIDSTQWNISERISFNLQNSMDMGLCNEEWRSVLAISFDHEVFQMIPGIDHNISLATDGMGEVLNTLGGALASHKKIIAELGQLVQTPPMYYSSSVVYPKTPSIQGQIQCGNQVIFFGWACRSAISPLMKIALERIESDQGEQS